MSKEFVSSSGTKFYQPIDYQYDEKVKCMVPVLGKKLNRYEMIQASKNSCDISVIVKRAKAGDISVLNVNVPTFGDVSDMPDNLNDLHELQNNSINNFNNLNPAIKNLFNNNVDTFMEAINDGSYINIINGYIKTLQDSKVTESEENK